MSYNNEYIVYRFRVGKKRETHAKGMDAIFFVVTNVDNIDYLIAFHKSLNKTASVFMILNILLETLEASQTRLTQIKVRILGLGEVLMRQEGIGGSQQRDTEYTKAQIVEIRSLQWKTLK